MATLNNILFLLSVTWFWDKSETEASLLDFQNMGRQQQQQQQISPDQLNQWLKMTTVNTPYIIVVLRQRKMSQDADNLYTKWFLQSNTSSIYTRSYVDDDVGAVPVDKQNRESYAIVAPIERFRQVAERFLQRAGAYFFILPEFNLNIAEEHCKYLWKRFKNYKIYMLAASGIWIYDPFEYVPSLQSYGRIMRFSGNMTLQYQLFHDMRGYPLRVQIFRSVYARPQYDREAMRVRSVGGADGHVAYLLQELMNFTMILQDPDPNYFGERDAHGNYNGAIGSIIREGLDICLTGFFIKDYLVGDYMDFSIPVYDDELCIYVPKAQRIPQSILPIFAVGYDIWLVFVFTAFICASIWLSFRFINLYFGIVRSPPGKSLWYQSWRIFSDTWVVWVRVTILRFPISYSERILIATLCLVSVIFGAIFESSLATVYIHPMHYKDINTLQELDDSGLKVAYKYSSMADDLFVSETSKLFANLNKKLTWVRDLNKDITQEIADFGGKASVTRSSSIKLESSHFILSKRIWVVPECPKYYTMSYVMPKDAPWEASMNDHLLNVVNGGLINKWIHDMHIHVAIQQRVKLLEFSNMQIYRILTIRDLQLAFYVVFFGNLLALLSFMIEKWKGTPSKTELNVTPPPKRK